MAEPAQTAPLCLCGHEQYAHRLGKKGCREIDCGCDRYEPVEERAERERVLQVVADVCDDHAAKARAELATLTGKSTEPPTPDPAADEIRRLRNQIKDAEGRTALIREQRDAARRKYQRLADEITQLREQLVDAHTARQALGAYDAWLCQACGSRYGQPYGDHGCGPLTPVTVTISRREAADA